MSATQTIESRIQPAAPLAPADEHRIHNRRHVDVELWMTDLSGETTLRCTCRNLSAGGVFAVTPLGYGMAVGQRYELRMIPEVAASGRSFFFSDSLGYGTVIRTQPIFGDEAGEIGVSIRFDKPQYLPV